MAVIYRHTRLDNNTVFYIGIGTKTRAFSKHKRNKYWNNIINKTNYEVQILKSDLTWEDACEMEKVLISWFGRRDLGLGTLVNLTDGGEGTQGIIVSDKTKQNMSISATGRKHSNEAKEKNRIASSNVSEETKLKRYLKNKGLKRTPEQCKRISESKMNTLLLDVVNGIYYKSMSEVCRIFGYSRKDIIRKLDNIEKNDTNLIRV